MNLISNLKISTSNYFNLLLTLIPFSFIAGNMIINIVTILLIISSLIFFRKKILGINFYLLDKLLFLFFFLVLFTGIYNDISLYINHSEFFQWRGGYETSIKSIFFLKYLLLYVVVRFLIEKKIVNLKFFFIACAVSTLFVSLDIFYQYVQGKDIFGFISNPKYRKLGGPFGDEYIAGGFIQRFSIFAFFLFSVFYSKFSTKYNFLINSVLFIIFFVGLILTGNRMPFLLFLLSILIMLAIEKHYRKNLITFVLLGIFSFLIVLNFNPKIKENFKQLYGTISHIVTYTINYSFNKEDRTLDRSVTYMGEFVSFYNTWKANKIFGGGIKNFTFYCLNEKAKLKTETISKCNMHPHNYYLEILTETGLLGFLIIILVFAKTFYLLFYNKNFSLFNEENKKIILPFFLLFFIEMFPIKSTGSFFTTGNASYIFLIFAVLIGLIRKYNSIENKI